MILSSFFWRLRCSELIWGSRWEPGKDQLNGQLRLRKRQEWLDGLVECFYGYLCLVRGGIGA